MAGKANEELILLLNTAGWRPETLARKLTATLAKRPGETRFVHPKTPYGWLNHGDVPHPPIPDLVVLLLSEELGEAIPFDRVWPAKARRSALWLPADHGMDVTWSQAGTVELLHGWVRDMLRRRGFTAISGAALTVPAWQWLDHGTKPVAPMNRDSAHVSPELVTAIEDHICRLRRLDDAQGGGDALGYVRDQFDVVARMLREQSYSARIGKRLHVALAELGQIAGFMAFDGNHHGLAQRYFLAGLHSAHTAGDRALAANILGMLAYQAAECGKVSDSLQLAAAAEAGAASTGATVRAMVQDRLTRCHAAAGDLVGVDRARTRARELLGQAQERPEQVPTWAYWVTPPCLDAHAGQALVEVANKVPGRRGRLLADSQSLLAPRVAVKPTDRYQRSAVFHGTYLALAHLYAGELDESVAIGRQALDRVGSVNSARSIGMLRQLRTELTAPARRNPTVRAFTTDLDAALAVP
jgi:hypothetical protein